MSRRPGLSRRSHRIFVTALILSPLVALVVLVVVMLRTIEGRAQDHTRPGGATSAEGTQAPFGR